MTSRRRNYAYLRESNLRGITTSRHDSLIMVKAHVTVSIRTIPEYRFLVPERKSKDIRKQSGKKF
jgi:hypothetical protein